MYAFYSSRIQKKLMQKPTYVHHCVQTVHNIPTFAYPTTAISKHTHTKCNFLSGPSYADWVPTRCSQRTSLTSSYSHPVYRVYRTVCRRAVTSTTRKSCAPTLWFTFDTKPLSVSVTHLEVAHMISWLLDHSGGKTASMCCVSIKKKKMARNMCRCATDMLRAPRFWISKWNQQTQSCKTS